MKKSIFLSLALAGVMLVSSCHKHRKGTHATQIINATTEMNKGYQFDLGAVSRQEKAKITEQARHYTLSEVRDDNANLADAMAHSTYNYMPAMNYTGTDEVSVTIAEGHHCDGHHDQHACGNSNCSHDHSDCDGDHNTTTYIIKINVTRAGTPASPVLTQNNVN